MRYLFEEVGVLRLESRHDPKNPYSGEVMKNCGMRYEGTRTVQTGTIPVSATALCMAW